MIKDIFPHQNLAAGQSAILVLQNPRTTRSLRITQCTYKHTKTK
jgi:hypothetical protein